MIVYGPVPSRRLGRSMGINNIPPKVCTYSCIYCQLGPSLEMAFERRKFYSPEKIFEEVNEKIALAEKNGEAIDYLTVVPDGEATLDENLGRLVDLLKTTGIKTAIITNASMTGLSDVRNELIKFDWVSLKVDAIDEVNWKKVNRPHPGLSLDEIKRGMVEFSQVYEGTLATETMLVHGVNDDNVNLARVADFIKKLTPETAYISIPTRPPAEEWVEPAKESALIKAYHIFGEHSINVELITGYEGNAFGHSGNVKEDILGTTSVHPMRTDAVKEYLEKEGLDMTFIDQMCEDGLLVKIHYEGNYFYLRNLKNAG